MKMKKEKKISTFSQPHYLNPKCIPIGLLHYTTILISNSSLILSHSRL